MPEPRFTSFAIAATDRTLPVPQRASESIFATPERRQSIGEEACTSLLPRAKSGQLGVSEEFPEQDRSMGRESPLWLGPVLEHPWTGEDPLSMTS